MPKLHELLAVEADLEGAYKRFWPRPITPWRNARTISRALFASSNFLKRIRKGTLNIIRDNI